MPPFHVSSHERHLRWSKAVPPLFHINSGDTVTFDLLDGGHNQITATSTTASLASFDFGIADPCNGPIYINDAAPGDVLHVSVLSLTPAAHGWTAIFPEFGLLAAEFPHPRLKIWTLQPGAAHTEFKLGIMVPVRPFLGVAGVAPAEGEAPPIPPRDTGGNMDCKLLTAGAELYLPVRVAGALFSCGDGHAAQGDGEVCGTAIETPMRAELRFEVLKGATWVQEPQFRSAPAESRGAEYAVLGIDQDMLEASRKAVRAMIRWLVETKGLEREEAYMLTSVVGDLRLAEVVDMPQFAVSCSVPLNIFVGEQFAK